MTVVTALHEKVFTTARVALCSGRSAIVDPAADVIHKREKTFGFRRKILGPKCPRSGSWSLPKPRMAAKRPGQHRGPLTRAYLEVREPLLWGFHNSKTGLCLPSYKAIVRVPSAVAPRSLFDCARYGV
jgi:hypothetical protein